MKTADAFSFTGGGTPSKEIPRYWQDGTVNWFTPSDITAADGMFLEESSDKCIDEGFTESSAKMLPAYPVMMTSRATIGAVGINLTPACTNQGYITCVPNERYPLPYLENLLRRNAHLQRTRDLLLPRLIAGKLPVEALAIAFPPSIAEAAKA